MATTTTTTDNLAIAYLIRERSPHLSARQLAMAVRVEDRRDTFGRKRSERTKRVAWSPAIADNVTAPDQVATDEPSPLVALVVERLTAAGLVDLVDFLKEGRSIREACEATGHAKSTVCDRLATVRAQLIRELANDSE